jgi:uncharacterized cupin superfamily protein
MKINKLFLAIIALSFAVGLIGGYRIWGMKEKGKADIKQLLERVNEEVEVIETRNKDLAAALEAAKEDIGKSEALKRENQELIEQLQNSLQEKKGMEIALEEVSAKESEAQVQAEAEKELRTVNDGMKEQITVLENENQELKNKLQRKEEETTEKEGLLSQVRAELAESRKKALQGEELKALSDDLQGRISELEKENQELTSVIDKISELTQIKEETRKIETDGSPESKEGEQNENLEIERGASAENLESQGVMSWPIWEKEVSEFPWAYDDRETCYLLEGDVIVTPEGGEPVRFGKGDFVTFPAGMRCRWKILKGVRKHYRFG